MKNSKEIINTLVISITEGKELGFVKDMVVNPEKKSVEFFLVEKTENHKTEAIVAIPFKSAIGIGGYAMTIEHQSSLIDLAQINFISGILEKRVRVIDEKVISRKGRLLGVVEEYTIDTDSGQITQLIVKSQSGHADTPIAAEDIISLGEHLITVTDRAEELFYTTASPPKSAAAGKERYPTQTIVTKAVSSVKSEPTPQPSPEVTPTQSSADEAHEKSSSIEYFVEKQKSFLLGKVIHKDFYDHTGQLIAAAGTPINSDIFIAAEKIGRQKIIELAMLAE
ncbi:PRC-barrel domain-containing protein [Thiorhodospira sibirica]|uniref:PRC-barrel domain-containing protein n=1 Tax=Thiorhodospira sibirica TaxID=154347 RepID=UPI00022C056C|nr:PRC-barrel domain-containing protein [Thiorhodospira sibirica]